MVKKEILGEEIWEVNKDEARELWRSHPDDRWRLWTHEEVDAHMLSDPETLAGIIERKKLKPGSCL
jgi:hypothetical protein